ncbi:MAG TPA: prepilin-type N-terminal cleavage/methylation domain-containing protein, partial [Chthonomonadaceae bacterium]|nr:prepilin-type N-terminal cleavage/methylation domain-containing protein [Chthonomonadaceae bacterium]
MRRASRGFTLMEMIVATLILTIGVVGAMTALSMATRASGYAQEIQNATLLAQQQLNDTQVHSDTLSGGDTEGDFDDPYSGYHWKQSVETTDYQKL